MGYGLASIATAAHGGVAEPVPVTTLGVLISSLGVSRLDFVKADIEGYEAAMLAGARTALRRYRPTLLLEHDASHLSRAGSSLDAMWAELVLLGYRPHRLAGGMTAPVEADQPQEGDLLWLPANTDADDTGAK